MKLDLNKIYASLESLVITHGLNIIFGLLLLIVGLKVSTIIAKKSEKALLAKNIDASLGHFLGSLISWFLKIAVVISAIKTMGFATTSFIAVLGSAGLAVGLALQGSLSNFAGGVLILLLKPFKVGDFIMAQGESGTVEAITTFSTTLLTGDNKRIILPNGSLANSKVTNVNANSTRRVDFVFGIGYDDDLKKAKMILEEHFKNDPRVLKDQKILVVLGELADSSVNINARAWTQTSDYWSFYWETLETIKEKFDKEGISIPFPQRDVHHYNQELSK